MAQGNGFPHLKLSLRGNFRAKFPGGVGKNPEVEKNKLKENRASHVGKLRGSLRRIGELFRVEIERRQREGLPAVDAGAGFVMRIPDGADPDEFAYKLGVELVAETDGGFMLVATQDLTFEKLEEVLTAFEAEKEGGGAAASLLEVFEPRDDIHRIDRLLAPDVRPMWPFKDDQEYVFDVSIQNAEGNWMNGAAWSADKALKLVGHGLPSVERATENAAHRVTLITPDLVMIRNREFHLYRIVIPADLRATAQDIALRVDVTLSYSSEPRRTRSSRRGYLATWLDWRSSGLNEPFDVFKKRMISGKEKGARNYKQPNWCLHFDSQHGDALDTHRSNGTVQKDWAKIPAHELPDELAIAVRAHKGWDHREGSGGAKYCLIVSFEAEDISIPVYSTVAAVNVEVETQIEQEIVVPSTTT